MAAASTRRTGHGPHTGQPTELLVILGRERAARSSPGDPAQEGAEGNKATQPAPDFKGIMGAFGDVSCWISEPAPAKWPSPLEDDEGIAGRSIHMWRGIIRSRRRSRRCRPPGRCAFAPAIQSPRWPVGHRERGICPQPRHRARPPAAATAAHGGGSRGAPGSWRQAHGHRPGFWLAGGTPISHRRAHVRRSCGRPGHWPPRSAPPLGSDLTRQGRRQSSGGAQGSGRAPHGRGRAHRPLGLRALWRRTGEPGPMP